MKLNPEIARSLIAHGRASIEQLAGMDPDFIYEAKSDPASMQFRMAAHEVLVRKDSDQTRTVSFIASDETVDRMGDIIKVKGWDLKNYRSNPIILWQHDAEQPIGNGVAKKGQTPGGNGALLMDITFAEKEAHPFADQVFQLVKAKVLRANSVGFMPIKAHKPESSEEREALGLGPYGVVFEKQELFEDSVVSVPANPSAVALAMTDMVQRSVLTQEQADRFLHDGMGEQPGDWFDNGRRSVHALGELGTKLREALEDAEEEPAETETPERDIYAPQRKEFDIEGQHIEAARLEHEWVSRWCSCEVKKLHNLSTFVSHLDAGSFLTGLDEAGLPGYKVHDTRSLTRDGLEVPPNFESVQLTETRSGDFLASGIRFVKSPDGLALAVKTERTWGGYTCAVWSHVDRVAEASDMLSKSWDWAEKNHFRRGAAFKLSGDFIRESADRWEDVFLANENRNVVTTAIHNINSKGAKAANRGMIWQGPPGTGKTLTARVLRNEAKATLIWCSSRDFMYYGGAEGIMRAFDLARRFAPAVIVLEDVDSWLGTHVMELLKTEMDGMARSTGVTTILTTNHPESLPKALIDRPGRFHDVLTFDLPDEGIRKAMFAKWFPELDSATSAHAVEESDGMSGAHVYELCAFAKSVAEQDGIEADAAMLRAIEKLKRQREQIGEHQKSLSYGLTATLGDAEAFIPFPGGSSIGVTAETSGYVRTLGTGWPMTATWEKQGDGTDTAAALTKLVETQTEQLTATRQLADVIADLARKVLDLNGKDAERQLPGDESGDEEIDLDDLRSVSEALARLAQSVKRK